MKLTEKQYNNRLLELKQLIQEANKVIVELKKGRELNTESEKVEWGDYWKHREGYEYK